MTVTLADFAPEVVGAKVTLIVQLAPAARVFPQLFVWANWPRSAPVRSIAVMVSAAVPEFVSVTICAELVVLMS